MFRLFTGSFYDKMKLAEEHAPGVIFHKYTLLIFE